MSITVYNRQRSVRFDLVWLRQFAAIARKFSRGVWADVNCPPVEHDEVEVTVVSDAVIADLHRRFMNIPGPTDVITFAHGEIVMSAGTARRNALRYGHSVEAELALYTIHGLLHLNGFDDIETRFAIRMRRVQNRLMKTCLAQMSAV